MAVANTKSTSITAFDAVPKSVAPGYKHKSPLYISRDTAEVAADDDNGSVYRILRLPSNACIKELNLLNDAITAGTDFDIGVYQTADNGGAVVDINLFGDAIDLSSERTLPLNAMYEGGIDIINGDTRLWELLGLSADPHREYDICLTGVAVGTGAGSVGLECVWSQ